MNDIRMLWEQHGVWTRSAIYSIALNLPDVDFVVKRLLQNPNAREHDEYLEYVHGYVLFFREYANEYVRHQ